MFKSIFKFITVFVIAIFSITQVQARTFTEGKDYEIRAENRTTTPEIREFFSFFCSHCFAMEKPFAQLNKSFENKATFIKNPIGVLGGEMGVESQKAYAVALHQGIVQDFTEELFNLIHEQNKMPDSHEYFVNLFESLGVPRETYEQDYSSFVTQGKVAEYDRYEQELKIDAVPEIVVNGKYLVITDNLESVEDYIELVNYLLTLD